MLALFWHDFLYQPLFNFLIWIYNNWTDENLGWAIVYLTISLRIILLPFTIVYQRDKAKNLVLYEDLKEIEKGYKKDPVLMKEEVRKVLKNRRVSPWAKAIVLGIQALVLVLLYQVFLRGITGEKIMKILYPSVDFPGVINTVFYGFDLGAHHDIIWASVVGLWLMIEIYMGLRRKSGLIKADLVYFILFPLTVFIVLWWLPMAKALFILTSMVFSALVGPILRIMFSPKKKSV
ncbi:YidC/Oxa1 family membrane protein insertase [Patescibacteria group bacterium]|nr:YidC/Oxa1 family membrane protein insertase [Patescibacteria group bacterium]